MSLPEPIDLLSSEDEEKAVPPTAMTLPPIVLSSGACKPLANAEEEAQQGALQIVVIDVDAGGAARLEQRWCPGDRNCVRAECQKGPDLQAAFCAG